MKAVELFDSRDKKKRLSHMRNLMILGFADGQLSNQERDLIFNIGLRSGLTPDELTRIQQRPGSIKYFPPESYRERIEQLYDLVLVMMVDGEIHKNELAICKGLAVNLGFRHEIIDKMVLNTINLIAEGIVVDNAISILLEQI